MRRKQIYIAVSVLLLCMVAGIGSWVIDSRQPRASHKTNNQPQTTDKPGRDTVTGQPEPKFDKTQYSTTDPASSWVVINKQHPLNPTSYAPTDLTSVGNGQRMRTEAAKALQRMFADAQAAGFTLIADSGYRSYGTQVSTYNGYIQKWGQTYTDTVSARPGYSEHQTGWAVDIGTGSCHVDSCFGNTPGGQWAQANAYKYGFILRYPTDLSAVTGYSNEAWHFRYIGTALSEELHKQNIATLEQFFDITGGTTYK